VNYKLRQSAKDDIKDIGRYTLSEFGSLQRSKYLLGLESHFRAIASMPRKCKSRSDLREGYFCSNYDQHIVFFQIQRDFVDIIAVLHKRMLPENHLSNR
jgi:toxin ParE1/3/4